MRFLNNNKNKRKDHSKCLNLHHKTNKQPKRNLSNACHKKKKRQAPPASSANSEIYQKQNKRSDQFFYLLNLYT